MRAASFKRLLDGARSGLNRPSQARVPQPILLHEGTNRIQNCLLGHADPRRVVYQLAANNQVDRIVALSRIDGRPPHRVALRYLGDKAIWPAANRERLTR